VFVYPYLCKFNSVITLKSVPGTNQVTGQWG